MSWTWRCEDVAGETVTPAGVEVGEQFPTQSDAESWVGELWPDLLSAGVAGVTLLQDGRVVYGPMSLRPAE